MIGKAWKLGAVVASALVTAGILVWLSRDALEGAWREATGKGGDDE